MKVSIVDYGAGNLQSVQNAVYRAGAESNIVREPEQILFSERLIVPGVGAAGTALEQLRGKKLDIALTDAVRLKGRPMLGICLGMQVLADKLFEFGEHRGFGWIKGNVEHIRSVEGAYKRVPHMGWNRVHTPNGRGSAFAEVMDGKEFYFCHSFTLRASSQEVIVATTEYGIDLVAAVLSGTVFATQFHPEKSQYHGLRLLEAFFRWKP